MPDETRASIWGKRTLEVAVLGIVEAAMWALIEEFPLWAKIATIIVGLLFVVSLNVKIGKFTKIVPWVLGLIYLTVAAVALTYRHPAQREVMIQTESGCKTREQTRPLRAKPMPGQVSDQQLMSEALILVSSLVNLAHVENNIMRQQLCGLSDADAKTQQCSLLQEYESNLRVPAQAIRQTMLDRLPVESRVSSYTAEITNAYSAPKTVSDLSTVSEDLMRLIDGMQKKDNVTAEIFKKQWIVPAPPKLEELPYKECDTNPIQSVSLKGCTGQLRGITVSTGPFGGIAPGFGTYKFLVIMKCENPPINYAKIRLYFQDKINLVDSDHNEGAASVGDNYIDFPTSTVYLSPSIEITTQGNVKIRRIVFF